MTRVLAADFAIPQPDGAGGWIFLLILLAAAIWILTAGFRSIFQSMTEKIRPYFYGLLGLGALYLFIQSWPGLQTDPLVETRVEVFPNAPAVDGTVQLSGTEDSNHSHDPAN